MRLDTRLSLALHALLHLAEAEEPLTSSQLAEQMHAESSVIRRTLAGLRELNYVASEKGHGGGWKIAANLETLTLFDVYEAVGRPALFAIGHRSEETQCLVERSVNGALNSAIDDAENFLLSRFRAITIGSLSATFTDLHQEHRKQHRKKSSK